jgi:hypothetical protein
LPALQALESATGAFPVEQFAHCVGKLGTADPAAGFYNLLDQHQFFAGKRATAKSLLISCWMHTIVLSLWYHSEPMAPSPAKNDRD